MGVSDPSRFTVVELTKDLKALVKEGEEVGSCDVVIVRATTVIGHIKTVSNSQVSSIIDSQQILQAVTFFPSDGSMGVTRFAIGKDNKPMVLSYDNHGEVLTRAWAKEKN